MGAQLDSLGWSVLDYCGEGSQHKKDARSQAQQEFADAKASLKQIRAEIKALNLFSHARVEDDRARGTVRHALAMDRAEKEQELEKAHQVLELLTTRALESVCFSAAFWCCVCAACFVPFC